MAMMISSCKSTMAVAALLVLVACASTSGAVGLSLGVSEVMFVNHLTVSLNVTIGALNVTIGELALGTPSSITLAPGATGKLPADVLAVLLKRDILVFHVNNTLYIDTASGAPGALGRLVALTGELKIVVSLGPCASGEAGLTLMDYAAGRLIYGAGCAVRQ